MNGRGTHVTTDTSQPVYANNRGELVIRRATSQVSGEYVCHAKNIAGHAQMDITIQVISGRPATSRPHAHRGHLALLGEELATSLDLTPS